MKIKKLVMTQGLVVGHGVNRALYDVQVLLEGAWLCNRACVTVL